jgi:hypothetical protein
MDYSKLLFTTKPEKDLGWFHYHSYKEKNNDGKWIPIIKDSIPNESDFDKEYNVLMAVRTDKLDIENPFYGGTDDYELMLS